MRVGTAARRAAILPEIPVRGTSNTSRGAGRSLCSRSSRSESPRRGRCAAEGACEDSRRAVVGGRGTRGIL